MTGVANGGRFPYAVDPGETTGVAPVRPKSLPRLFAQGKWWRRSSGEWVRVRDMHPAHRANAARLLLQDAPAWVQKVAMAELGLLVGAPQDLIVAAYEEDQVRTADPVAWMRSTKLYRRLVKGLPLDAEAVARLTALPDFTLTIPVGGPPAVSYTDDATRALRMVLTVLEQWRDGVRHNHDAGDHRDEDRPCWDTFDVEDIRRMVTDAARQIGVTL